MGKFVLKDGNNLHRVEDVEFRVKMARKLGYVVFEAFPSIHGGWILQGQSFDLRQYTVLHYRKDLTEALRLFSTLTNLNMLVGIYSFLNLDLMINGTVIIKYTNGERFCKIDDLANEMCNLISDYLAEDPSKSESV
jgi:hypothetical protein